MKINHLVLGDYQTNCYILQNSSDSKQCVLIDAGLEAEKLINYLDVNTLVPAGVILTHGHIDHIMGVKILRKTFPELKVYMHKQDARMLTGNIANLGLLAGTLFKTKLPDFFLEDGEVFEQAGIKLLVLHTPGHTPGGISLYSESDSVVFVGDSLFEGSIGRTDFPGGDMNQLVQSIKTKLLTLPGQTTVCPGHGEPTTIDIEMHTNPFLV